jgi:hypothetical protein
MFVGIEVDGMTGCIGPVLPHETPDHQAGLMLALPLAGQGVKVRTTGKAEEPCTTSRAAAFQAAGTLSFSPLFRSSEILCWAVLQRPYPPQSNRYLSVDGWCSERSEPSRSRH